MFQHMEEMVVAHNIEVELDVLDVRILVKQYLSVRGRYAPRFKGNVPDHEWVVSFLSGQ